jgi:hypothetical protein
MFSQHVNVREVSLDFLLRTKRPPILLVNPRAHRTSELFFAMHVYIQGGFKNQPQQLMFSRGFSEFHIEQELVVNRYGCSKSERFPRTCI